MSRVLLRLTEEPHFNLGLETVKIIINDRGNIQGHQL